MSTWNPEQYLKYKDERTRPSHDLVARIALEPSRIVDIGCGPGNSTQVLRERWPQAYLVGMDSSPEMIAKARQAYPQEQWVLADAATWQPQERYDLVFSNAALQWIPNHAPLIQHLLALVGPKGALAVQVPANNDAPLYLAVGRVSTRPRWREAMRGCNELLTYHDARFYYDQLAAVARVDFWQTTYYHVMNSRQDILDWYASTGMRPYLERLGSDAEQIAFQAEVLAECAAEYPEQQDGKVLFPFRRLFLIAYKT
jgi:trans-aconitate 2-methyltransferase